MESEGAMPALSALLCVVHGCVERLRDAGKVTVSAAQSDPIAPVIEALEGVTHETFHLPQPTHRYVVPRLDESTCRYLHVYEDEALSIGVFVLPPRAQIPLHSHPHMTVLSRLLCGDLTLQCFDSVAEESLTESEVQELQQAQEEEAVKRAKEDPLEQGLRSRTSSMEPFPPDNSGEAGPSGSGVSGQQPEQHARPLWCEEVFHETLHAPRTYTLYPDLRNIHMLEAGDDGCVVLDILLPPYSTNDGRGCSYYAATRTHDSRTLLVPREPPKSFAVIRGDIKFTASTATPAKRRGGVKANELPSTPHAAPSPRKVDGRGTGAQIETAAAVDQPPSMNDIGGDATQGRWADDKRSSDDFFEDDSVRSDVGSSPLAANPHHDVVAAAPTQPPSCPESNTSSGNSAPLPSGDVDRATFAAGAGTEARTDAVAKSSSTSPAPPSISFSLSASSASSSSTSAGASHSTATARALPDKQPPLHRVQTDSEVEQSVQPAPSDTPPEEHEHTAAAAATTAAVTAPRDSGIAR